MMTCYQCRNPYEPDPEKVRAWVESERSFNPTDWKCPECQAVWLNDLNAEAKCESDHV